MKTLAMVIVALGLFSGAARADGLLLAPEQLPAATREALASEIREARTGDSRPFDALAAVRRKLPELDASKRGGLVPISRMLKAMGRDAYLPVVEELAFKSSGVDELPRSAALAWKIGLLETLGNLRVPNAEPLLTTVLKRGETQFEVVRAAADALGKLGTDSAAQTLVQLASISGVRRAPVLAGMGSCRRLVVAEALANELARIEDEGAAKQIIKSLGDVGNAWAWQTPAVSHRDEEAQVRRTAAEALVKAFVRFEQQARQAASNALMVVDAPETPQAIEQAKHEASAEQRDALDSLSARFARNPAR